MKSCYTEFVCRKFARVVQTGEETGSEQSAKQHRHFHRYGRVDLIEECREKPSRQPALGRNITNATRTHMNPDYGLHLIHLTRLTEFLNTQQVDCFKNSTKHKTINTVDRSSKTPCISTSLSFLKSLPKRHAKTRNTNTRYLSNPSNNDNETPTLKNKHPHHDLIKKTLIKKKPILQLLYTCISPSKSPTSMPSRADRTGSTWPDVPLQQRDRQQFGLPAD